MRGPWHDVWQREKNADSPGLFLRLFTPTRPANPMLASAAFPGHDISLLHGIPAIGDKFTSAATLGPQSTPHTIDGTFSATVLSLRRLPAMRPLGTARGSNGGR